MINVQERLKGRTEVIRQALAQHGCDLRVAIPAVVQSFDEEEQTVTVQPAVQELIRIARLPTDVSLPVLEDVPIVLPRAGGFSLTLPVSAGDECLVIFADMCIDAWWQSGAQDGPERQLEVRRHDLSDGFAILGPWSQPRRLTGYSGTSAQLRSDDGSVVIDVAAGRVTITAPEVITAETVANAGPLVTAAFWQWFTTVLYPELVFKSPATPPVLPPAPLSTVFKGE